MKKVLPILVEKDETGYYVVECPLFRGCYTQGKTLEEAKKNLQEVLDLILEEPENRQILENYEPRSYQLKTVTYA